MLDFVLPNGVVVRGRCQGSPFSGRRQGADAVILVGGDADGYSISSECVVFDQPVIAGIILWYRVGKTGDVFRS